MPVYEVMLAITSYAFVDIEAPDNTEAVRIGMAEWEAYKHEADGAELTGIGCRDANGVTQIEPV